MNPFNQDQQNLSVSNNQVGVSWTGQAGFAFKDCEGLIYHVDPYLSNICSRYIGYHRMMDPPVGAEDMRVDIIFFTHEHRDHLDQDSVPMMASKNKDAIFVGPPACVSILMELGIPYERVLTIKRGETKKIGNIHVQAVLAHHTDDSIGYVFDFGTTKFYVTGDTTYSDDLIPIAALKPDVMMTCMNGRLGCMNIPDACRLTAHIQPLVAVPMHHGMFRENTADPKEYVRQVEVYSGITKGFMMEQGKWYLYQMENGFKAFNL